MADQWDTGSPLADTQATTDMSGRPDKSPELLDSIRHLHALVIVERATVLDRGSVDELNTVAFR